jgi:hypothetical protein
MKNSHPETGVRANPTPPKAPQSLSIPNFPVENKVWTLGQLPDTFSLNNSAQVTCNNVLRETIPFPRNNPLLPKAQPYLVEPMMRRNPKTRAETRPYIRVNEARSPSSRLTRTPQRVQDQIVSKKKSKSLPTKKMTRPPN